MSKTNWQKTVPWTTRFAVWLFGHLSALNWAINKESSGNEYTSYELMRLKFTLGSANRFCRSYFWQVLGSDNYPKIVTARPKFAIAKTAGCYHYNLHTIYVYPNSRRQSPWGILIHEMAHVTKDGHGIAFIAEMYRIWFYGNMLNLTHRRTRRGH